MTTGAVALESASPRRRLTVWALGVLGVTFLAEPLFGYDQGVISGALSIVNAIGEATTFFLFSALCVVAFVWTYVRVPETRGRSLEEIQELWGPEALPPAQSGA